MEQNVEIGYRRLDERSPEQICRCGHKRDQHNDYVADDPARYGYCVLPFVDKGGGSCKECKCWMFDPQ